MKLLCARQFSSLLAVGFFVTLLGSAPVATVQAETGPDTSSGQVSRRRDAGRAYPRVQLSSELQLSYLGMYSPDAVFHACPRVSAFNHHVPGEEVVPVQQLSPNSPQNAVPEWMLLSSERVVENLEPPSHARAALPAVSHPARVRNQFLTMLYGRPSVIHTARHVATDSRQRLVLSDPDGHAIHVLDPQGKTSFRLVAGKGYRLHQPEGVAVDAHDNVYVADSDQGTVVVFDSGGNFVRYIGKIHGEAQYARPHGIAIDPQKQQLYLVDTPRNMVFKLDLDGNVLKVIGRDRRGHGEGEFQSPTEIAVNHKYIYILDRWGTRVQVWDMNLKQVGSFELPGGVEPGRLLDNGLSADQDSRVYVSHFGSSLVGVYDPNGHLVSLFGQNGTLAGQFASPAGLWVDPQNRLYVADSGNARVQVFQLSSAK